MDNMDNAEFQKMIDTYFQRARNESRKLYSDELQEIFSLADVHQPTKFTIPGDMIEGNPSGEDYVIETSDEPDLSEEKVQAVLDGLVEKGILTFNAETGMYSRNDAEFLGEILRDGKVGES